MSNEETQQEELEVLQSIYEGEEAFKQISETVFQYKFGEDGACKSFLVEISWPSDYPESLPNINLDVFYNKHVVADVKEAVINGITEQANDLIGMSMTYTLFEWVKDNLDSILSQQPDTPIGQTSVIASDKKDVKEKKEQLTKNQKRRMFERFGHLADRPRGWDWVDIVKHLAQTGSGSEAASAN